MRTQSKWAWMLACVLCASGAGATMSYTTVATGVIEKAVMDRAVCTVSNTSTLSVMVDEVRILNAAGAVVASLGATTLGAMETLSLEQLPGDALTRGLSSHNRVTGGGLRASPSSSQRLAGGSSSVVPAV